MSDPTGKWCPFMRVEHMQEPPLSDGMTASGMNQVVTNRNASVSPQYGSGYVPIEVNCIGNQCAAYVAASSVQAYCALMRHPEL